MAKAESKMLVQRPPVKVQLVGTDSNAFALIGRWKQAAVRLQEVADYCTQYDNDRKADAFGKGGLQHP